MAHHTASLALDGALHVVKLPEKLERVLDLGTGTGIWAIDMAECVYAPTPDPAHASAVLI